MATTTVTRGGGTIILNAISGNGVLGHNGESIPGYVSERVRIDSVINQAVVYAMSRSFTPSFDNDWQQRTVAS